MEGSLGEQDCSSPDTSEQALLGGAALGASRTVSHSEPDLSSVTANTEKATESTTIMIDVQDSTVVQSEDHSLFLSARRGELKAAHVAFPIHIHGVGGGVHPIIPCHPSRCPHSREWGRSGAEAAPHPTWLQAKALISLQLATRPMEKPAP